MLILSRATSRDTDAVVQLLTERAGWLAGRGSDQWSEKDPTRDTDATIAAGETWLLHGGSTVLGTLTMTTRPDLDFWSATATALYLSKLATPVQLIGKGYGKALLHAACLYGVDRDIAQLRWDVWRSNTSLQAYYQSLGAKPAGLVEVPGRRSGALFTMPTAWQEALQARQAGALQVEGDRYSYRQILATKRVDAPSIIGGESWDREAAQGAPTHWHDAVDLVTEEGRPVRINPVAASPSTLHHTGDGWRLDGYPVTGSALKRLQPGLPYTVAHRESFGKCQVEITGDALPGRPGGAARPMVGVGMS